MKYILNYENMRYVILEVNGNIFTITEYYIINGQKHYTVKNKNIDDIKSSDSYLISIVKEILSYYEKEDASIHRKNLLF